MNMNLGEFAPIPAAANAGQGRQQQTRAHPTVAATMPPAATLRAKIMIAGPDPQALQLQPLRPSSCG